MAADVWRVRAHRGRVHHEPLHRNARVRGRGAGLRGSAGRPRWIPDIGRSRLRGTVRRRREQSEDVTRDLMSEYRKDRGREMTQSRPACRYVGPLTLGLAGIALWLLAAGCERGDAKGKGSAAPIPTVLVAVVDQRTVPVGADFVARTEGVPTVEIRARISGVLDQVRFREGSAVKQG